MAGQSNTLRLVLLLLLSLEAYSAGEAGAKTTVATTVANTETDSVTVDEAPSIAKCGANETQIGSQCYNRISNKTWESATDFLQALFLDKMCDDGAALFALQNETVIKDIQQNVIDATKGVDYMFLGIGHICNTSNATNGTIMPESQKHKLAAKDATHIKEIFSKDNCTYGNGVPIVHCLMLTLENGTLLSTDCLHMTESPQQYALLCGGDKATTAVTVKPHDVTIASAAPAGNGSAGNDTGKGPEPAGGGAGSPEGVKAGGGSHSSGLWQGMLIATMIIAAAAVTIVAVRQWRRRQRRLRASRFFGSRTRLNFDQLQNDVFDNDLEEPSAPEGGMQQTAH